MNTDHEAIVAALEGIAELAARLGRLTRRIDAVERQIAGHPPPPPPVRGGAAKDPPGADPYASPGLRDVPAPDADGPMRSYRMVLGADAVDVINAALFMAAPLLDEGPQKRWGGGANVRRVQAEFFAALEVARREDSPSAVCAPCGHSEETHFEGGVCVVEGCSCHRFESERDARLRRLGRG